MRYLKARFLTAFFIAALLHNAQAQVMPKGTSLVSVSYTYPDLLADFVQSYLGGSYWGPVAISYQYCPVNNLLVGIQGSYSGGHSAPVTWNNGGTDETFTLHYTVATASVKADYYYLAYKKLKFYSGGTIGYGVATPRVEGTAAISVAQFSAMVWYVNVLGCRFSLSDHIAVYAEGGVGILGWANFGLSVAFGKKAVPKNSHNSSSTRRAR